MQNQLGESNKLLNNTMLLGYIYLFSRIFLSVYNNVFTKLIFKPRGLGEFDIAFYGSIFGIIFMASIFPFRKKLFGPGRFKDVGIFTLILASFFGVAMYNIFYNASTLRIGAGLSAILYYVYPVFLYVIGNIIVDNDVKKAFSPKVLCGIAVCLIGVVYIYLGKVNTGNPSDDLSGYISIFLAATSMVIFSIMAKKNRIPTYWFLMIGQILAFVVSLSKYAFDMIQTGGTSLSIPQIDLTAILVAASFGILSNVSREFFRIKSIEYLPISQITTWNYFSPLATSIGGVLFLRESFGWDIFVGYLLVILGNVISNFKISKRVQK